MSAAEKIAPMSTALLPWSEICVRHPDEWVCLVEVEHEIEGSIRSGRVVGHHRSIKEALKQAGSWGSHLAVTCSHTGGRKLRFPRIVMTDEIREFVRIRW